MIEDRKDAFSAAAHWRGHNAHRPIEVVFFKSPPNVVKDLIVELMRVGIDPKTVGPLSDSETPKLGKVHRIQVFAKPASSTFTETPRSASLAI